MAINVVITKGCGFCNVPGKHPEHHGCAIGTKHRGKHEKYKNGVVWVCGCPCNEGRRKCANCGSKNTDEVDPATWECFDIEACKASIENRRANDPFLVKLRDIQEKVDMAKTEQAKTEKAAKTPKVGKCLVTGEPTKGGLFKPGMDARYVSLRVAEVMEKQSTAAQAKKRMKDDGVSDTLIAKFEKNLGIAQDKAAKKAEAEKAKKAEKTEKTGK